MIEKLYTVEEVAELASVTGRTIRNYLKSGRLVGRKIGGQWRFPETEVQRLLTGADDDLTEENTEEEAPTMASSVPAWVPPVGLPLIDDPTSIQINSVNSSNFYESTPLPPPESAPVSSTISGYPTTAPEVAVSAVIPPASAQPTPQPLPDLPFPQRPQPAPAPSPICQQPTTAEPTVPVQLQQSYFSGDLSQEYSQPTAYTPTQPPLSPPANTTPPSVAPVYAAPITPLPEREPPYQYRDIPVAAVQPIQPVQPAPLPQPTQRLAPPPEVQPAAPAPQQPLYATYAAPPQGGYAPPPNQQGYQNISVPMSYSPLYGQNTPLPAYPPMPQNYYGFAPPQPEPAAPTKMETALPKQEAPLTKEPTSADESDYPPPTKRPKLVDEPAVSEVGKRVSRFISEVHDCSSGPLSCTVLDIYMSLSSAKSTSEHLADIARQESTDGPRCQSFVEYDERFYVARFTLFGSSAFLYRCLQLIG